MYSYCSTFRISSSPFLTPKQHRPFVKNNCLILYEKVQFELYLHCNLSYILFYSVWMYYISVKVHKQVNIYKMKFQNNFSAMCLYYDPMS